MCIENRKENMAIVESHVQLSLGTLGSNPNEIKKKLKIRERRSQTQHLLMEGILFEFNQGGK